MGEQKQEKLSLLAKWAIGTGFTTVGLPIAWATAVIVAGGNDAFAIGWYGILPVLLLVAPGVIMTIILSIVAAARSTDRGSTETETSATKVCE